MNIQEKWEILVDGVEIDNVDMQEEIKNLVKQDILAYKKEIEETINKLVSEFLKQEYIEGDLTTEIKYKIDVYENGYRLWTNVYVYPSQHPQATKFVNVICDRYVYFVHESFTKPRNELGLKVKQDVAVYCRLAEMKKQNEELRIKLEKVEAELKELQERLQEQEEEDP